MFEVIGPIPLPPCYLIQREQGGSTKRPTLLSPPTPLLQSVFPGGLSISSLFLLLILPTLNPKYLLAGVGAGKS